MTGHIPESFIDELLARVDIVDILQGRIELKRAGGNFVARCPFHTEKTPSFNVSPSKQFYHCFGCGAHGNALRFLTEYDGMHFVDAIEYLANRVGLMVPRNPLDSEYDKSKLFAEIYTMLTAANDFYQKELLQGRQRDKAVHYLKNRGLHKNSLLDFQVGYAPPEWDALFKALARDKTAIELLLSAGLILTKDNKPYFDRFRDRIMFPIRNRRGQIVGFGGRTLLDATPKYLNSPETKVFSKSHELYGLYEARQKLKKLQSLIVVEGYLDVITLVQFGIKNVIATLGTALTEKHLEILFKEVSELIFCFDGDHAGREAAHRVLLLCLPYMNEGRRVRFILLPEKEDPDSYMRSLGLEAFEASIHGAKNLSDFLFESFLSNVDLNQMEGRAEYIRRLRPLIAKVPSKVLQHMLYERLGELARIAPERIEDERPFNNNNLNKKTQFASHNKVNSRQCDNKNRSGPLSPAYKASALLLENPSLIRYIKTPHGLELGNEHDTLLLSSIIEILLQDPNLPTQTVLEKLNHFGVREKEISFITNFNDMITMVPPEGKEAEFLGAIERVKERLFDITLEALIVKAKTAPLSPQEKTELKELLIQKERGGE